MDLQHINVKLFAERPEAVDREKFTSIFQGWIQDQVCEELLLDVADYLHVDAGPGIVLIGEEADYSMDETKHRLGLRYNRKRGLALDNAAKLAQALRAALQACLRLEADPRLEGKLKFSRREVELFVNDRAVAPNTEATWAASRADLEAFFAKAFAGKAFQLARQANPRERFGVTIKTEQDFDPQAILQAL